MFCIQGVSVVKMWVAGRMPALHAESAEADFVGWQTWVFPPCRIPDRRVNRRGMRELQICRNGTDRTALGISDLRFRIGGNRTDRTDRTDAPERMRASALRQAHGRRSQGSTVGVYLRSSAVKTPEGGSGHPPLPMAYAVNPAYPCSSRERTAMPASCRRYSRNGTDRTALGLSGLRIGGNRTDGTEAWEQAPWGKAVASYSALQGLSAFFSPLTIDHGPLTI